MVTSYVKTCLPMIGHFCDSIIVALLLNSGCKIIQLETVASLLNKNSNLDSLTFCHKTKFNERTAICFHPCNSVLLPQNTGSVLLFCFFPNSQVCWWHLVIWHGERKETILFNTGPRKKIFASPQCFILIFFVVMSGKPVQSLLIQDVDHSRVS